MAGGIVGVPLMRRHYLFRNPMTSTFRGGSMDWLESPAAHIFKINVPGFGKEQIKVQVEEGNILLIRGEGALISEKKETVEEEETVWHLAERGGSAANADFSREIELPENINGSDQGLRGKWGARHSCPKTDLFS